MELAARLFMHAVDHPALSEADDLLSIDFDTDENEKKVDAILDEIAKSLGVSDEELDAVKDHVLSELLNLGPLSIVLEDETIKEAFTNSRGELLVWRDGAAPEKLG